MQLSLYFDIKNFGSANFSRIVITALVCAMMPIGLHRNNLHITFLPQSLWFGGVTPSLHLRSFNYL